LNQWFLERFDDLLDLIFEVVLAETPAFGDLAEDGSTLPIGESGDLLAEAVHAETFEYPISTTYAEDSGLGFAEGSAKRPDI
jgi:hypothetical protein